MTTRLPTTVELLDPREDADDAVDAVVERLHPELVRAWPQDQPYDPPPTLRALRADVRATGQGDPVRLLVATSGDELAGVVQVGLPERDNRHVALLELFVVPGARRTGVAGDLWTSAAALAHAGGRTTLLTEARVGAPLEAFLASRGAQPELTEVVRHQRVDQLDLDEVRRLRGAAAACAPGYRLVTWAGTTPPEHLALSAAAQLALNDAPTGGLDYQDEVWDADRVAARDAVMVAGGRRLHAVVALAADGSPAGYTEVWVEEDGTFAWQWGTAVTAAHRGHRLGMLLKTTMLERLRELEPRLRTLATGNADTNTHMVAVNDALGHRPVDAVREWQLVLPAGVRAR